MEESNELKQIKELYGESFMCLCKDFFPKLLEQKGLLTEILKTSFGDNTQTLYEDLKQHSLENDFKNYIFSKVDVEKEKIEIKGKRSPYELLNEAGYNLYECKSEDDIQRFKKYYIPGEELCTFKGRRLNICVVFWAVRKDVDKIKRDDFKTPKREDEYGTSVMSIQFYKGKNSTVSIKNRYNHTVKNPDATYGNDLDRIIPGLTHSFANLLAKRGVKLNLKDKEELKLPNYIEANDGRYYKYNMEINGIYYCPGNIIIDHGEVKKLKQGKEELMDYYIIDKVKNTIELYDPKISDSLIDVFRNIEKVRIINNPDGKKQTRIIIIQRRKNKTLIKIEIDKNNNIVGYENKDIIYKRDIADLDRRERLTLTDLNTAEKNMRKQYDTKSKYI